MRTFVSVTVGLIALALGLIPMLNSFGVIAYELPFTLPSMVLAVLMVIGAIILFVDASDASMDFVQWGSILSGIVIIVLGLGIIVGGFVPSVAAIATTVTAIPWVMDILLIISAFFLIIGGIMGY